MLESIIMALFGGVLIGTAASVLLVLNGEICGVSSILGGIIRPGGEGRDWRVAFVTGLIVGGGLLVMWLPAAIHASSTRSSMVLAVAGLLVGFGTRLGGGCTSGHGVCGLGRGSKRSLVATLVFMAAGFATATTLGALGLGAS